MNFADFKHVETLIYFDLPLLDQYEYNGKTMLVCWCDISDDRLTDYYFVFEVSPENLEAYLAKTMTLRQLIEVSPSLQRMTYDGSPATFEPLTFADIPEDMRPTTDSFYF